MNNNYKQIIHNTYSYHPNRVLDEHWNNLSKESKNTFENLKKIKKIKKIKILL